MRKLDLIKEIAKATGIELIVVEAVINASVITQRKAVIGGDAIYIRGFGTLYPKQYNSRRARNITAGKEMQLPPRVKPVFKPCKTFIERCNSK